MNKNKGIIGLGLIVAIVLGIIVVGGGAYYLGTKKNTKVVENTSVTNPIEENNSHEVPAGPYGTEADYVAPEKIGTDFNIEGPWPNQTVSQGCTKIKGISAPIILSPNGGEIYQAGQQITVKWNSCAPVSNNPKNTVGIFIFMTSAPAGTGVELAHITADDGSEVVTLPTLSSWSDMKYGKNFKIKVWYPQYDSIASPSDSSDNSFTINSGTKTVSTTLPAKYISSQNWPPVVKTSGSIYLCKVSSGSGDVPTVVEEKNINGKKYCITSVSDHAMSHTYTDYTYTTSYKEGTKTTNFVISQTSCGVYRENLGDGGIEYNECMNTVSAFLNNLDTMVDSIMQR